MNTTSFQTTLKDEGTKEPNESLVRPRKASNASEEELKYIKSGILENVPKVILLDLASSASQSSICSQRLSRQSKREKEDISREKRKMEKKRERATRREEILSSKRGERGSETGTEVENTANMSFRSVSANNKETGGETESMTSDGNRNTVQPSGTEKGYETGDTDIPPENKGIISGIKKRERGRPPIINESGSYAYKELGERRTKEKELAELQREADVLNPALKPNDTKSYREFVELIEEKQGEFLQVPPQDLEAIIADKTSAIYKVAVGSKNMKGTMIKYTKEAAAEMCAAGTALAIKAQNPTAVGQCKQLEELRKQVWRLSMENVHLKKALGKLQKRGKRQAKVTSQSISSSDDELMEVMPKGTKSRRREEGKRDGETSQPLGSGEISTSSRRGIEERRNTGTSLPPKGGEVPVSLKEREKEGSGQMSRSEATSMEVERLEEFQPAASIYMEEEHAILDVYPSMQTQESMRGNQEEAQAKSKEEKEAEKELAIIAKLEGIVVRVLEQNGLIKPLPTYVEQKREKARRTDKGERFAKTNRIFRIPPPSTGEGAAAEIQK